jgi:hypothetical protein
MRKKRVRKAKVTLKSLNPARSHFEQRGTLLIPSFISAFGT